MFSSSDVNPYLVLVTFICLILGAVGPYLRRQLQWWRAFSRLPGPSYVQQITFLWKLLFKRIPDLTVAYQTFLTPYCMRYPLIGMGGGNSSFVVLCKAEAAKVILSSKTQIEKASLYKHMMGLLGDGLAASKGAKWHQRRRLLTPSFHVDMLESYLVVMNKQADTLVHLLEEKSKEANGTAFDICPYTSSCAMNIICETIMGQRLNALKNNNFEYVTAVESVELHLLRRFLTPWLWIDMIYQFMQTSKEECRAMEMAKRFPKEVVKNKLRKFSDSKIANGPKQQFSEDVLRKKRQLAMLDILVEMSVADGGSEPLTEEDIRDEVKTFMFAGSGSSYFTVSWALYHIGRNPDVQRKIVDELNLVHGDRDRNNSSDDLNQLKYLECVIKETLRLHPPAPSIGRHITEEMNICGSTIPADTDVFITIYWVHRDPAQYPDPETFDPDRFLPENSQDRDPFAFIPFAAGLRNCIGQKFAMMEAKVILSAILRRFQVKAIQRCQTLKSFDAFTGCPLDGVWAQFETRKTG